MPPEGAEQKPKPEKKKPEPGEPKAEKPKSDGKGEGKKAKADAGAEAAEGKGKGKEKPPEPKRAPIDPRVKVYKKFHGKFLPRGPLRDRWTELKKRWDSTPEHGGVTVEELKSLLAEWKADRAKRGKAAV
jgi:hypothetical protein